jgi:glutamine amidotransferase
MNVSILDYGMCNLLSVVRAFEHCGAKVIVLDRATDIGNIDRLVIPGVGAFPDCLKEMRACGMDRMITEFANSGRPLLGICVGMQALFEESEEFGLSPGLGLLPGSVVAIQSTAADGSRLRIPHIGWCPLIYPDLRTTWVNSVLEGLPDRPEMYFVHSYTAVPKVAEHRLADAKYGGRLISAAVQADNIVGLQFHPEKSASLGLTVISNFLRI